MSESKVIFVADYYLDTLVGGAEMSTEVLINSCPHKVVRLISKEVTKVEIDQYKDSLWVITNYSHMEDPIIKQITEQIKYVIVEYDFKLCVHRSPERHGYRTAEECNCDIPVRKEFYDKAGMVFFMSVKQMRWFQSRIPFLKGVVLSSLFDAQTLDTINDCRMNKKEDYTIIIHSDSWIKGAREAVKYCIERDIDYKYLVKVPYVEVLIELGRAKRFVYKPQGGDTCPRTVIEAKLLGCELDINDFVLHKDEAWFRDGDEKSIEDYLRGRPAFFWEKVNEQIPHTLEDARTHN